MSDQSPAAGTAAPPRSSASAPSLGACLLAYGVEPSEPIRQGVRSWLAALKGRAVGVADLLDLLAEPERDERRPIEGALPTNRGTR